MRRFRSWIGRFYGGLGPAVVESGDKSALAEGKPTAAGAQNVELKKEI
jgi:hypothetical protein